MSASYDQTPIIHLGESFLRAYADYLKQLKGNEPEKTFMVEISLEIQAEGKVHVSAPSITVIGREGK